MRKGWNSLISGSYRLVLNIRALLKYLALLPSPPSPPPFSHRSLQTRCFPHWIHRFPLQFGPLAAGAALLLLLLSSQSAQWAPCRHATVITKRTVGSMPSCYCHHKAHSGLHAVMLLSSRSAQWSPCRHATVITKRTVGSMLSCHTRQ
jgi:hypothetical protein